MAKITALCISGKRQEPKDEVFEAFFSSGGIEGDSHRGVTEREVSLLRREDIRRAEEEAGFPFPPGALAENVIAEGLPEELPVGTILALGEKVRLKVIEKGKKPGEPHSYDYRGWCLLPVSGYFLSVLEGGRARRGDKVMIL